jgi:hypothetical protein
MNYKTTYILFGLLTAILVVVSLVWLFEPAPEEGGKFLLPSANGKTPIKSSDIVKVKIERTRPDAETLTFERDETSKTWKITSPRAVRASTSNVENLVRDVLQVEAAPKVDVPANLKAAELDPPAETITLTTKDAKELKVNFGAESPFETGGVVYLSSSEKPSAPTPVLKSSLASAFKKLSFFRNAYLLESAVPNYSGVKLTLSKTDKKESKGPLSLTKKDEGLWEYSYPEGYDGSAEQGTAGTRLEAGKEREAGVEGLLKVLSDLQVAADKDDQSDFVADDVPDADLAKYDLDPATSDVMTIVVDRIESIKDESGSQKTEKSTVTALIGVGKKIEEKDKPAKYYAAVKGDKGYSVVKVAATGPDAIALLFKDSTYLCNHNLAALGASQPVAVDVTNADGTLSFRRETGTSFDWRLYRDGKEITADTSAISAMVNQLVQPGQVRAFLDPKSEAAKLGLDKPAATVSIWTDGVVKEEEKKDEAEKKDDKKDDKKDENKDEKKEEKKPKLVLAPDKVGKPAVKLTFGAVEGEDVAIKREATHVVKEGDQKKDWNESAFVKAPKLIEDQAKAGALAYYSKELPGFNVRFDAADKDVIKLAIDRADGEHYVISRAEPKPESPWKFEEPKEMADRKVDQSAVSSILFGLHDLRATSLVAEAPKDEDVDKTYGLKAPSLKVVVTKKDDKNSPYTFEFGKDAADGNVYARQNQRTMVFEVSKLQADSLKKDLRDPTIFAFDPLKVKTLKMTGWQKKSGGEVLTRELERKDDKTWTVKTPPTIQMSSDKLNKVVGDLSRLTAERFVSRNAAIKAEYDKEEPKNAFTVELKVDGVDAPQALKVVDLTGNQTLPEADRQVYATSPQAAGELFQVKRTIFTAPAGMPMQIGPMDEAGYFSP